MADRRRSTPARILGTYEELKNLRLPHPALIGLNSTHAYFMDRRGRVAKERRRCNAQGLPSVDRRNPFHPRDRRVS